MFLQTTQLFIYIPLEDGGNFLQIGGCSHVWFQPPWMAMNRFWRENMKFLKHFCSKITPYLLKC